MAKGATIRGLHDVSPRRVQKLTRRSTPYALRALKIQFKALESAGFEILLLWAANTALSSDDHAVVAGPPGGLESVDGDLGIGPCRGAVVG